MIQYVFEAAESSDASDVFIITEDQEIMDAVEAFGEGTSSFRNEEREVNRRRGS